MRGTAPFLFVKLVQQRRTQNHAKPAHRVRRSSSQPFPGTTRSAGVGGFGLALAILVGLAKNSDIGRVGKKMVLRRIPIYFLSTIFHDLKARLTYAYDMHNFNVRRFFSHCGELAVNFTGTIYAFSTSLSYNHIVPLCFVYRKRCQTTVVAQAARLFEGNKV